jgi:hypothetical protein
MNKDNIPKLLKQLRALQINIQVQTQVSVDTIQAELHASVQAIEVLIEEVHAMALEETPVVTPIRHARRTGEYTLQRVSGEVIVAYTQAEILNKTGLCSATTNRLINRKVLVSRDGWFMVSNVTILALRLRERVEAGSVDECDMNEVLAIIEEGTTRFTTAGE